MSNRQRTSEIVRDVVVFVTGAVLVASTVWLPVQGDQEVTGAILVLGILAASSALWAIGSISNSASSRGSTARQSSIVCAGVVQGSDSTSSTSRESSARRCSRSHGGGRNRAERGTVASRVDGSVVQPRRYAAER